jgi:hypothetical protein
MCLERSEMTINQNSQADPEPRLKEMEEENDLLLLQLHKVQEELERYYLRNQELEKGRSVVSGAPESIAWVDDELPDILAENQRLNALVKAQQKVYQIETQNALSAKLGNILIQGADSPASLFSVPGKLGKIWRESSRQVPPDALGGKGFDKLIAGYEGGGFDAVEKLLAKVSISLAMQANAYTALARQLMKKDRIGAVEAARRAHALDPKPFRLKWLAFRLYETGELIEAEAMLDILPADTQFSDSEARQADQLRYDAKLARYRESKKKTAFAERKAAVEKRLENLTQERDQNSRLADARAREIEALKQAKAQLEEEKQTLVGKHEAQTRLAEERVREIEVLKQTRAQLEGEKQTLVGKHEAQTRLAEGRAREIEALKQTRAQLEGEKQMLVGRHEAQAWLAEERGREVESLRQTKKAVEQIALLDAYKQGVKDVDKRLSNAVKQIEAFVSIQNYLTTGYSLPSFHLAAISPDMGLFLIERLRERHYDLIIEFGSGTSTVLFVKVLQITRHGAAAGETTLTDRSRGIQSIQSFEHDIFYLHKTRALLASQGLDEQVALTHAPLIDWQDESGSYIYYDCDAALGVLARRLADGNAKRLLILVDGPPGSTCPNARYPAVPFVFKHLGRHEIDLVLDDANRAEEKAIVELWRGFWKRRFIHMTQESVASEKGLYWARNYGGN